jgi:tetratricopeptide (TPR) repeat protein
MLENDTGISPVFGSFFQSQTHVLEGRLEDASDALREPRTGEAGAPGGALMVDLKRFALALLRKQAGDDDEAHELAEVLAIGSEDPSDLLGFRQAALLEIELGQPSHAESMLPRMTRLAERYPGRFARGAVAHVSGELARAKGRKLEAGLKLDEAVRLWRDVPAVWSLARFRMEGGEVAKALPLYEEILFRKGEILRREPALYWELAQFEIARCLQALGRDREAARRYEEFLRVWRTSGDEELVREAESRRRELRPGR